MRIISGLHKGRRIVAPKKLPVRPTTDRSKEALFNILQHRIDFSELRALDLYAGTGSISYELASRGATQITAVDQNRFCVKFIEATSNALSMGIYTIQSECIRFLEQNSSTYYLIFADPPYDFLEETYETIVALALKKLNDHGQLIIEHFNKIDLSSLRGFEFSRNYGSATFSFFTETRREISEETAAF